MKRTHAVCFTGERYFFSGGSYPTTAGEERLRALVPAKGGPTGESLFYVEFGPVAERIVRVAAENYVDLIVMGIATAGAAAAHLAEGDAYKVVGAAPCPVLTIRG